MSNRFIQKRFNSSPEGDVDLNDVGEVNKVYRICALSLQYLGKFCFQVTADVRSTLLVVVNLPVNVKAHLWKKQISNYVSLPFQKFQPPEKSRAHSLPPPKRYVLSFFGEVLVIGNPNH